MLGTVSLFPKPARGEVETLPERTTVLVPLVRVVGLSSQLCPVPLAGIGARANSVIVGTPLTAGPLNASVHALIPGAAFACPLTQGWVAVLHPNPVSPI